jgi:hypothetical protein
MQLSCYLFKSNTIGSTIGTANADLSGATEFIPVFSGVSVARTLIFCVIFCRQLLGLLEHKDLDLHLWYDDQKY